MANGLVSLGYLRMQAQQRSDTENNPAISPSEWNQYLSSSYKELYDLIVAAYGNDYYAAQAYQFSVTGANFYNLPDGSSNYLIGGNPAPAFYKLLGVDLQNTSSPTGWLTLRNFEFIERNKYGSPNTSVNALGLTNLRYRLLGSQLWFTPAPAAGQSAQIWYVPEPTSLQFAPTAALTLGSPIITVSDPLGISAGMSVYASNGIATGTTVLSVNTTTKQVTLSANANATFPIQTVLFWSDATTIDGVSGWEEFIIVDAAIKACIKIETEIDALVGQKAALVKRIEAMAEGRDAGQAHHVSDALAANGGFDDGFGGMGGGWGGF